MKSFLRTFLIAFVFGTALGLFWGYYFDWGGSLEYRLGMSGLIGLILGFLAAVMTRYRENRVLESGPALADEKLLREGRATYKGAAGCLYITDRRVLFEGYPTDENSPEVSTLFDRFPSDAQSDRHVSLPILQISEVVPRAVGINPGIELVVSDGRKLFFLTEDPIQWIDDISEARQKFLDDPRSEDMKLFP